MPSLSHRFYRNVARRVALRGFTLIELMITLAILAVLIAIALPAYQSYVLRTHRTDALATLAQDQATLERFYAVNFTYVGCCNNSDGTPMFPAQGQISPQAFYTITMAIDNAQPPNYTLTAVPAQGSPQQADTTCATLTINQANVKGATDSNGTSQPSCWNP